MRSDVELVEVSVSRLAAVGWRRRVGPDRLLSRLVGSVFVVVVVAVAAVLPVVAAG
jgi:hypothetical protein